MSSTSHQERPVIGPGWVLGSILVGMTVTVLILFGGAVEFGVAVGLALISILLAIGFATEKIVMILERTGSLPGSPERPGPELR